MNSFEVTPEMIVAWGNHFGSKSIDDVPGIVGSLYGLAEGLGELPAELVDAEATRDMFAKLRSRFYASKGVAEPPYSIIDTPVVEPEIVAEAQPEIAPSVEEVPSVEVEVSGEVSSEEVAE